MPATTNVNFRTVVHQKSSGMAMFFPDVCNTPAPPAPPIPIPYPNIAQSTDTAMGSTQVKIDGCSIMLKDANFKMSTGDEAGSLGGLMSVTTKGKAEFVNYSFDVKVEGKNVPRMGDMMLGNKMSSPNTPPMPEVQPPLVVPPPVETEVTEDIQLEKLEEREPEAEKTKEVKEPTIKAKWSKKEVTPDHNSTYPPPMAPYDDVPEEAKVLLEVVTTDVPNGQDAVIEIRHAKSKALIKNGKIEGLKVKGNKVIDPFTGVAPEWFFNAEHGLWSDWEAPFYYFSCTVQYKSLRTETQRNYTDDEGNVLRLKYWHVCTGDYEADHTGDPNRDLSTEDEMNEISGILNGLPHHKAFGNLYRQEYPTLADVGSVLRNTFVYHHAGHGVVKCRTNPMKSFAHDEDGNPLYCAEDHSHSGRSVMYIGSSSFGEAEVAFDAEVPSVPKYLMYFSCCDAGWDKGMAETFVSRGTRNVLAFRKVVGDTPAREMATNFYTMWVTTHKCDPAKIPEVFFETGSAFYDDLRPVLFGNGGGRIKGPEGGGGPGILEILEYAAIIVGAIALGAAIGWGVYQILK